MGHGWIERGQRDGHRRGLRGCGTLRLAPVRPHRRRIRLGAGVRLAALLAAVLVLAALACGPGGVPPARAEEIPAEIRIG